MLIDWFTVIAQAINFLVLVWLLKRFLYKPILDAIDGREQRIAKELAEAAETKAAAEQQREEYEQKNQQFGHDRDALIAQMKKEIDTKRQKLLDDAHQSAEAISVKRLEALQREQLTFADELTLQTQSQVFAIARKTLHDLADTSLEERMAEVFRIKLHDMRGSAKRELAEALAKSSEPVRVRTAFELPGEQQTAIRETLKDIFAGDIHVRFEVAPHAIGGIELTASGRKIAWSIDEYLTSLQKSIAELTARGATNLKEDSEPDTARLSESFS